MAYIKEVENEYGVNFEYHKVREVRISADDKDGIILHIIVESYANKDARQQGKNPVVTDNVIVGADFAMTPFYKILRAKFPQFTDAEDDMDNSHKQEIHPEEKKITQSPDHKVMKKWENK